MLALRQLLTAALQCWSRLCRCPAGFTNIDFLEAVFKGYGSPYDIVRWDVHSVSPPKPDLNALLYNADGSARYSSIFMCVRPWHSPMPATRLVQRAC
jgi:hypothetical protein